MSRSPEPAAAAPLPDDAVDPQAYLASTLTRLINRHPASQIDQLMPWAYPDHVH